MDKAIVLGPKGQSISKANCLVVNSSKKRTNEFILTIMQRVLVHFLEEIEDTKKAFWNYPTFKAYSHFDLQVVKTADICWP